MSRSKREKLARDDKPAGETPARAGHLRDAAAIVADLRKLTDLFETGRATVEGRGKPAKNLRAAIGELHRLCGLKKLDLPAIAQACRDIRKAWPSGGGVSIGGSLAGQVRSQSSQWFSEASNHPEFQ